MRGPSSPQAESLNERQHQIRFIVGRAAPPGRAPSH